MRALPWAVGANGTGKSTLLKLMLQDLEPVQGEVRQSRMCKVGVYNQHSCDQLAKDVRLAKGEKLTPVSFLMHTFPDIKYQVQPASSSLLPVAAQPPTMALALTLTLTLDLTTTHHSTFNPHPRPRPHPQPHPHPHHSPLTPHQDVRNALGRFGLEGQHHEQDIHTLSGGQKSRVVFVELGLKRTHLLLLDEPTNHLDLETVDALVTALKEFKGGVMVITHNVSLINAVCSQVHTMDTLTPTP